MPTDVISLDDERQRLLADVAEMYYLQGLTQNQIAQHLEIDRSTVSRMLAEARREKIVDVRISRPLAIDLDLQGQLRERAGFQDALVMVTRGENPDSLLRRLGEITAQYIVPKLEHNMIIGLSWGTGVSAVVDALQINHFIPLKIVQLVGSLGAQTTAYDGHGLVQRLAQKLDSESYILNAPFSVESPEIARSLMNTPSVQQALDLGRRCDLAILGVGSTEMAHSSFYQAGYVPAEELHQLQELGMVGDVCGLHFTEAGMAPEIDFHQRIITINSQDLRSIPLRVALASGEYKVKPVLGALRAGFINVLITDQKTARGILSLLA